MNLRSAIFAGLVAQLALSAPPDTKAPAPPYVEINPSLLDPDIPAQLPPDTHRDLTFAFSPDERWLAIVADVYRRQDPGGRALGPFSITRVLLLPLNGRREDVIQIDPHFTDPRFMVVGSPVWSPDSDALLVKGLALVPATGNRKLPDVIVKAFNLRGEELMQRTTSFPPPTGGIYGFLDSKTLLAHSVSGNAFQTTDLQGSVIRSWKVPKEWNVVDISVTPDRQLLLVSPDDQNSKTLVVDYSSKKVLASKDNPYNHPFSSPGTALPPYFAEHGMTFCSPGDFAWPGPGQPDPGRTSTECWNVDSGKRIAQFRRFLGGAPAAVTSGGSLIVLTDNFPVKSARSVSALKGPGFSERIIWDFRTGSEIAAWDTSLEDIGGAYRDTPVAISSMGRYVAEGAGDILRLYRVR